MKFIWRELKTLGLVLLLLVLCSPFIAVVAGAWWVLTEWPIWLLGDTDLARGIQIALTIGLFVGLWMFAGWYERREERHWRTPERNIGER